MGWVGLIVCRDYLNVCLVVCNCVVSVQWSQVVRLAYLELSGVWLSFNGRSNSPNDQNETNQHAIGEISHAYSMEALVLIICLMRWCFSVLVEIEEFICCLTTFTSNRVEQIAVGWQRKGKEIQSSEQKKRRQLEN